LQKDQSKWQLIGVKKENGNLWTHLWRAHKKCKKRYGKADRRGSIPNRVMIDQRPSVVDEETRILIQNGEWYNAHELFFKVCSCPLLLCQMVAKNPLTKPLVFLRLPSQI
jgi:hypothetical protein